MPFHLTTAPFIFTYVLLSSYIDTVEEALFRKFHLSEQNKRIINSYKIPPLWIYSNAKNTEIAVTFYDKGKKILATKIKLSSRLR